ncbi:transcriptional repressor ILP1 [Amaranthus tricolor]|uniref:transcriptional repressor ILP1 n=1 Tax=Amaranthus tricolor TaxID=29722 RepID=UPI00258F3136|nr:transcriptional repressor ILP1 [Amaranthus tricolor]
MSSRSKNFRRRAGDEETDDSDENRGSGFPSVSTKSGTKSSVKKHPISDKPKKSHHKLLSFAEDEESETPFSHPRKSSSSRLSKSISSHKITTVKDRPVSSTTSVFSNNQPSAGTYTKEVLLELQKNTKTLASSKSRLSISDTKPSSSSEPVIIMKGLLKPVLETGNDGDELTKDKPSRNEASSLKREKDDAEIRFGLMGIGKEEASEAYVMNQEQINAIRAKREKLRQSRPAAPDYISLDAGSNHGAAEGLSDEEPEFQTRIAMLGEKIDGPRIGVFEDVDERPVRAGHSNMDDDEDEEERIWEEEQFRKGLGKRMDEGSTAVSRNASAVQPQSYVYTGPVSYSSIPHVPAGPPSIGGAISGVQAVGTLSISQQATIAKQAFQDNLKRLKETRGKTMTSLVGVDENLAASLLNISVLEKSSSDTGEKYIFMQRLRNFVKNICDFLQDKAPYIEELEEQMQQLHKKHALAVFERRAADNDDEMSEVQAAVDAAVSVLGKGSTNAANVAGAAQAAAAAFKQQRSFPVKLDEYGRDSNLQKRMDMARRFDARQRRRSRFDSKRMMCSVNGDSYARMEGESSTDESDNENEAYKSNRDLLLQTAADVFSDATEEYSQLSSVKEIFERWKKLYLVSYRDAYMSLSIPSIFSPYVRVELLKWDPLHEDVDFNDMRWHSLLFNYGVPEDGSDFNPDDADADLVPGLVEKVALPLLHHEIAHCWDILSSRESKNAVSATTVIINYVSASSEALKELIAAIRTRLADAVANLVVPSWSIAVMKAVPNAARVAAYRFGVAVRLIRNICMWKDILALPVLEKLVLDELLGGKILPHVRNLIPDIHDAITRTERIIASITGVWTGASVTAAHSRKLQPLIDYVLMLGKTLEKKYASGQPETSDLARRLKKMLVDLNEYDEARAILRTFNLREAL